MCIRDRTTHYLEEAESLCRHIAIINRGRVAEREGMTRLLGRLEAETFVLNLKQPLTDAPQLPDFPSVLLDDMSLEVELLRGQSVNSLFSALSRRGIEVASLRNKQNRLAPVSYTHLDVYKRQTSWPSPRAARRS